MKIIDLLNKIANGEEVPKYIKYYDRLHQKEDAMMCCYNNIIYKLDNNIFDLLDEVEIIEEDKKIEKIKTLNADDSDILSSLEIALDFRTLKKKINELIDKANSLEDK